MNFSMMDADFIWSLKYFQKLLVRGRKFSLVSSGDCRGESGVLRRGGKNPAPISLSRFCRSRKPCRPREESRESPPERESDESDRFL